jgi:hypothetical protein
MGFGFFILTILTVLFVFLIFAAPFRIPAWYAPYDEEEATVTTTTTESPTYNVVGHLKRQYEGKQAFVNDPVDGEKSWLNSNDDMYEDAEGKVWRLV